MIRALFSALLLALPVAAQDLPPGLEEVAQFGPGPGQPTEAVQPLRLRSTTDIDVLRPAMEAFAARHPEVSMTYEQWSSNGLYEVTRRDCAAGRASADAAFSSAVDQLVELVDLGCAEPYRSALTAALPDTRRWRDEIWGLTREPAVIIYNARLVPPEDVPRDRFDLLDLMRRPDRRYDGRIATYDIARSGLGYLFAFADSLEASTFGALLEGFGRSQAVATCCSAEIIDAVAQGDYLMAYNVLGSYVEERHQPDVATVWPSDYTLFLSRAYMIPRGAPGAVAAQELLDFLLSTEGQQVLTRIGLGAREDASEAGRHDFAERPIRTGPVLLVARDTQKTSALLRRWRETFVERGATP